MINQFNAGDVLGHKADGRKIVILKVLKRRWWRKEQKYVVRWYEQIKGDTGYHEGIAFEIELEKLH